MHKIFKYIYNILPFKKEFFSFLKLFWKPKEHVYKHLHFKGIFKIKVDKNCSFKMKHYGFQVENDVFWSGLAGNWEKESLQLWIALCKQASVIIDVGANTGIYALIAKATAPKAKVYAFEPVKRVYEKLVANKELNKYDIICYESALSNNDGTASIFDTNSEHTYSVTVNQDLNTSGLVTFKTQIKTTRLSTFISNEKLTKIDLMKIDVESHEPEVLEGMGTYIDQMRPTLLIEILNNDIGAKVESLLRNLNYIYFRVDQLGIVKTSDISVKSNYCNYLICDKVVARKLNLI